MLAEGIFILTVSLSGNYDDLEFVGYFNDCSVAIQYFKENCSEHKAASCLLKEYSNIPPNHKQPSQFDFDTIRESQSCGFVGVETRNIFLKEE
jgi:hypothetical protein|tara:strand:- start:1912 stop:2190 length:279 start_codon:yes stop_codon:yes gene_type:complete